MTGAIFAALLAATALPEGKARWRLEMSGEHVGVVELDIRCARGACAAVWTSQRRSPADAGGWRSSRRAEVHVDEGGVWRGGRLRVSEDGTPVDVVGHSGAVPALLAEVVLARRIPIRQIRDRVTRTCVDAFDETTGERGLACARRDGDVIDATVLGAAERIVPGPRGFPESVELPAQNARFVRDDAATLPREAPRLHGMVVAGPRNPARARSFCGIPRDAEPPAAAEGSLPPPRADGASCREKTRAWLSGAERAGWKGRTAVGVAWDGARFVWHAWAEVRAGEAWIPVDPSFEQLPARGPRFTVAAYDDGDAAARLRAGERILACWGREGVR